MNVQIAKQFLKQIRTNINLYVISGMVEAIMCVNARCVMKMCVANKLSVTGGKR